MTWSGLERIESTIVDFEEGYVEVSAVDGRVIRLPGDSWATLPGDGPLDFKRVTFRPRDLVITMITPRDEELEAEVFDYGDMAERREGRPVVYLDQNKWVQIALALHRPERVHGPELEPTFRLIEMARAKELILPVSSGHSIEIGPLFGKRRLDIAVQMVGLSRGWIMADPLRVRASELRALFSSLDDDSIGSIEESVFTLDSRHFHSEAAPPDLSRSGVPPEAVLLADALSGTQAVLATLLESEGAPREGVEEASRWASLHGQLARHLVSEPRNKSHLRTITLHAFLSDLGDDLFHALHESGTTSSEYERWLGEKADGDIAQLRYLGRKRELMHLRLLNAQVPWGVNDLIDVLFLPCAAGYADYVVSEKLTGDYLQRANRGREDGARVFTSVAALISEMNLRE